MSETAANISIRSFAGSGMTGALLRAAGPLLDRLLGLTDIADLYRSYELGGLDHRAFTERFLERQNIRPLGAEALLAEMPRVGPAIVVCNHPLGGVEGIAMAAILSPHRSDVKIMANAGLRVFQNLAGLFIFTHPLSPSSLSNVASLRQCDRHLRRGGLLVLFPAGRVSAFQPELERVGDAPWNRLPAQLSARHNAPVITAFVSGTNSRLFHQVGRIHPRLRMLMLARELLNFRDRDLCITSSRALPAASLKRMGDAKEVTALLRLRTYLNDPAQRVEWPQGPSVAQGEPLAAPFDRALIAQEVAALPETQRLVDFKHFSVYYGTQAQLPETVREIARLREKTFRLLDEGSGRPIDTDRFDATYIHLFVRNHLDGEILGAYRLGASDDLLRDGDLSQLYLSAMFDFGPGFENRIGPALELGRSFIVPEYQRSPHGLFLLWRGIGTFVARNPRYRTLYGTVSLSKTYGPRTVDLIDRALTVSGADVVAKRPFRVPPHPDLVDYLRARKPSLSQLSHLVQTVEQDGKDLPVLVKQYAKLGARFHCIGIDESFNGTPGMLLSINLPSAPRSMLDRYLGDAADSYVKGKHE